jgi:hypothetical protein
MISRMYFAKNGLQIPPSAVIYNALAFPIDSLLSTDLV